MVNGKRRRDDGGAFIYSLFTIHRLLLCPVHAAPGGEEEAAAQVLVVDGVGGRVELVGAVEGRRLGVVSLVLAAAQAPALLAHRLRVNAELDVGDDRLAEHGVEAEDEL